MNSSQNLHMHKERITVTEDCLGMVSINFVAVYVDHSKVVPLLQCFVFVVC